jgi:YggT family protein
MGTIGVTIYQAAQMLVNLIDFLIFIRIILSWVPFIGQNNPIVNIIYSLTEPILSPIREIIRKSPIGSAGMMLDFSPVIAWLIFGAILGVLRSILL